MASRRVATDSSVSGLKWGEAAEREVGHVGDALCGEGLDQVVIDPVGEVVEVLHAHDRRDRLGLGGLLRGDGADAEMLDQSFLLHLRERDERLGDRARLGAVEPPDAQIDDIEGVEAEVDEVVVHGLAQLLGRPRVWPAALCVAIRPDLGDDMQLVRIGVQGLLDDLVRDVWAVIVTGVDMRDAQFDCLAQHGYRSVTVPWRPEDTGTGELHRAIPHASDRQVRGHSERAAGKCLRCHQQSSFRSRRSTSVPGH